MPLALATIAQTHALLVGYLDLSVGSMISFGVVVGSFLIGADASDVRHRLRGSLSSSRCGCGLGLVNAVLIRGLKIPSLIATLGDAQHPRRHLADDATDRSGCHQRRPVSVLKTSVGPIPIAFIVIVVGAGLLDLWLHGSGSGLGCARSVSTNVRRSAAGSGPTGSGSALCALGVIWPRSRRCS